VHRIAKGFQLFLESCELQRLIADCRAGLIDTVVTKDPARLSRDSGQLMLHLHVFQKADVRVEYMEEGHSDRFLEIVLSAIAELEEARRQSAAEHS
jgi:DNA invertase Pin-like site-specific DNA recombinase